MTRPVFFIAREASALAFISIFATAGWFLSAARTSRIVMGHMFAWDAGQPPLLAAAVSLEQCTTALPEFDRNLRMPAWEARRGDNAAAHRMIAHSLGRRAAQAAA